MPKTTTNRKKNQLILLKDFIRREISLLYFLYGRFLTLRQHDVEETSHKRKHILIFYATQW